MQTDDKLKRVLELLDEMKTADVVTVPAAERTILTDYFVLATANSNTHAKATANHLSVRLKAQGVHANHVEADPGWEWTIIDLDDIVVHLFQEAARHYYNLEELWGLVARAREKKEPARKRTRP